MKKILLVIIGTMMLQSCLKDREEKIPVAPFEGAIVEPNIGGSAEPNQVWFDLSTNTHITNERPKWDLAFYSGKEFRVGINYSIMMAAGKIEGATDIDKVTSEMVSNLKEDVQVATFTPDNERYIDNPEGNYISGRTAIGEISTTEKDNAIYLVNMGKEIYKGDIEKGSVSTGGDARGWMKVQITREGSAYKLKYAKLDDTTHKEVIIHKNPQYNFTFFSLKDNKEVNIQPEKKNWDLCFTVFTNVIPGAGSYIYSDFVLVNNLGNVGAYVISVPNGQNATEVYNKLSKKDIEENKLIYNDQRTIGGSWRDVFSKSVNAKNIYIIKDSDGLYYKLRFTRLTNIKEERGYPQFEYKTL